MNDADPFVRALTGSEEQQTVTLSRLYRATPAELWDAITTPERIARWYGEIVGPVPSRPGDAFEVDLGGGTVRRAVLESCQPPTALTYTWWSGDDDPGLVRLRLEPQGDRTRLTVQHDRLRPHRMPQYGAGWQGNLVALAGLLGGDSGDTAGAGSAVEWQLLGAHPLRTELRIAAPAERVWDAWASADVLAAWWWSHWDDVRIEADVRPGGRYLIEARRHGMSLSGEYLVVEQGRRIAFTWVWTDDDGASRDEAVDVAFEEDDDATTVVVRHTGPWSDDAPADSYRQGWDFVLGQLSQRLA